jgi:O-antigen/teichoic acid export membrane protein
MLLTMSGNMVWLSRRFAKLQPSLFDRGFLRQALPQALPLGLAGVFVLLYYRTGSVLVEALAGEVPAGQYGLAYRFMEALIFLPTLVVAVFLPRLSRLFGDRDYTQFRHLLGRGSGFLGSSSVVIALALTLAAPAIIRFIDPTPEAAPAVLALQILVWSFPFSSLAYLLVTALTAMNEQTSLAWMLGLAAAFNIALNAALIPAYSLYGACVATLVTQGLLVLVMTWRYLKATTEETPEAADLERQSDTALTSSG